MTRFKLVIEYDGRGFVGWQRQAQGASIQQALEEAVTRFSGDITTVHGAGRTDVGVHARAMAAHVDIVKDIKAHRLMSALNAHLRPHAIAILDCTAVADDWHARFSCVGRVYEYQIINRRAPLTWQRGLYWQIIQTLDSDAMHRAAQCLVGQYDFTTFRSVHCQAQTAHKTLDRLDVTAVGEHITIRTEARSFLQHQVRSMVGCLGLVGRGIWSVEDLQAARDAANRHALGLNAPPDGLYFVAAHYASP